MNKGVDMAIDYDEIRRKHFTIFIDPEVLKTFRIMCDIKKIKYSHIIEKFMNDFIEEVGSNE